MRLFSISISFVFLFGVLAKAEFSAKKIHDYASNVRTTKEAKEYIDNLDPDKIVDLVDLLDFSKDGKGENLFLFSFTCRKARQLIRENRSFDEDYVFGKLVDFVRSAMSHGHVTMGGNAMNSFVRFDHPEILKLAHELKNSDDEVTKGRAENLLAVHESMLRERSRDQRHLSRKPSRTSANNKYQSKVTTQDTPSEGSESSGWKNIFLVMLLIVPVCLALRWLKKVPSP